MVTVPLSGELSEEVIDALKDIAGRRGVSVNEALRQAISHDKYFQDAVDQDKKILLEEPNSRSFRRVMLAPSVKSGTRI